MSFVEDKKSPKSPSVSLDSLKINLLEDESSFQPIPYEKLPRVVSDEIDNIASELFDVDLGRIAITGSPLSGKSFLINQVAGNIDRYLHKVNLDTMVFVRLKRTDVDQILAIPGGYGTYIAFVCEELDVEERSVCFVVEDPYVASFLFSHTDRARIILEVSMPTFARMAEMEENGETKVWGSWRFLDVNEILLPKKDLINLLEEVLKDKMAETFNVPADKRLISLFVNYSLKHIPELLSTDLDPRGLVMAPMGAWASTIRSLCGVIGLSESPDIRRGDKVIVGKVIETVFAENAGMLAGFLEDEEDQVLTVISDGKVTQIRIRTNGGDDDEEDKKVDVTALKFNDMSILDEELHKEIIGQDEAIEAVVEGLVVPAAGLHDPTKPLRSFLFLGPTGVGKTKLATTLAAHAGTTPMNVIRIDMSEYSQSHEAAKLLGAPPGYAGFDQGGVLTNAIMANPNSVVLLDEIEKAHPKIWDSFLQILDAGRMTDAQGEVADFTQSIIIMTSNLGASDLARNNTGFSGISAAAQYEDRQRNSKSIVMKAVESTLRPEMINRIDEMVLFKELSQETARKIVRKEIDIIASRALKAGFMLNNVSDEIVDELLLKSNVSKYGARDIQRIVLKNVSNPVAKAIVNAKSKEKRPISLVIGEEKNISVLANE